MTVDEYQSLVKSQNYSCAICARKDCKLNIDHCHKTGKVRGILCSRCNNALYLIENYKDKALSYLNDT